VAAEHYAARQWQEAADAFLAAASTTADKERAATARFYAGEALVQLGKFDQAQRRLAEFLDEAPGHRLAKTALFRLGECLLLAGDIEGATAKLELFRTTYPSDELNGFVLAYLGDLALRAGKPDEALTRFEQALREFPAGPMAAQCRLGAGRASEAIGKADEALAAYRQVAASGGPLADDAALHLAMVQHRRKEYRAAEESLAAFDAAHQSSPLRPVALYWRGQAQLAGGRPGDAARSLRAAVEALGAERAGPVHYVALADALRQAGELAAADEAYSRMLERWPACDEAAEALGGRLAIAEQDGNAERAESLAGELLRRFPGNPHAAAARFTSARLLIMREEFAQAEPMLEALVAVEGPNREQTRYLLGLAQLCQGKHEAALKTVEDARADDANVAAAVREVRAAALVGLKRFREAVPLLEQLAADATAVAVEQRWRTQLVIAHGELGQLDAAAAQLDKLPAAALADADVASAALVVAEKAYQAGDSALAKRWFEALAQEPAAASVRTTALSGLAWTQLALEGKEASAATFERLLRDYPDSPLAAEAAIVRGRSLEERGEHNAALTSYRLVIDKYAQSPQVPAALLAAGRLHDQLDQDREAAELLRRLVDHFREFAQLDAAIYSLAWVLGDLDRSDEAHALFVRLSADFPTSQYWADATYRLAQQAARQKDHARAVELADRIVAADCPAEIHQHALFLRGQSAAALGRWNEAAQSMQRLIDEHPATDLRPAAEYWLAEADFRRSEFAAAREKLERLARESSARSEAWTANVPLRIVQCLLQERRWSDAIEHAQTALTVRPDHPERHQLEYLIGRALAGQGKLDDARAAYERALASPSAAGTETAAAAQWMIGEAYFHQKNYRAALAAYERASAGAAFPRWQAASLLQAGKCRLLLGQTEQAAADFQKLAGELGETPYAAEARQRLAALGKPASRPDATSSNIPIRTQ
jgi:TolA-binding protein